MDLVASAKTTSSRALALAQALDLEERALEVGHAVVFPITFFFLCFFFLLSFYFCLLLLPSLLWLPWCSWRRRAGSGFGIDKKKKERWQEKDLDVEPDTCKRGIPI